MEFYKITKNVTGTFVSHKIVCDNIPVEKEIIFDVYAWVMIEVRERSVSKATSA